MRVRVVALAAVLAAGFQAAPARADVSFGAPVTVVDAPCRYSPASADAAAGPDGRTHGFVRFANRGCGDRVFYFEGTGAGWTNARSPYRGRVLAAAADASGSYLLYEDGRATRIARRTASGVFSGGRVVGGPATTGGLIAAGGRWWAVWRERSGELFESRTMGRPVMRARVALEASASTVALAARPGGVAVLVTGAPGGAARLAVGSGGGWRFERTIAGAGAGATVATSERVTAVTGSAARYSDDRSAWRPEDALPNRGGPVDLALSGGNAFLAWTRRDRVQFAGRAGDGTWTVLTVSAPAATPQRMAAVTATGGKATVLMLSPSRLYARTQTSPQG
jgi:hypothetical protein